MVVRILFVWGLFAPAYAIAQTVRLASIPKATLDEPGRTLPELDLTFVEPGARQDIDPDEEELRLFCFDLQTGAVFHGSNIGDFLGDLTGGSAVGRITFWPDSELTAFSVDGSFSAYGGVSDWSTTFSVVRPWEPDRMLPVEVDLGVAFDLMGVEGTLGAPGEFHASQINFAAGAQLTQWTYARALYSHPTSGADRVFRPITAAFGVFIELETRRKFQVALDHQLTDNLLVTAYWTHFAQPDQHFGGFGFDWFLNDTAYLFGTAHFGEGSDPIFGSDEFAFAGFGFRWGGCRANTRRPLFELGRPNLDVGQGASVILPPGFTVGMLPGG